MQVVLLRVGVDTGSGGIHGPLFKDGSFEYVPIWDKSNRFGVNTQTYANTQGRCRAFIEYFPLQLRQKRQNTSIHYDPEFETFTYSDPTRPKASLRKLKRGDLLAFYAGLEGWNFRCDPALYIIGYFEVMKAGLATKFTRTEIRTVFGNNFHVRHRAIFKDQRERLVLVKGGPRAGCLGKLS